MIGLASAARRLVVAARWNHHGALITASGPQLAKTSAGAGVGAHVRTISTVSEDAHTMKAANARIAKKMAANHRLNYMDDETMELKKESLAQFLESRLQMDRLVAMRTIALHPPLMAYSHETLERKIDWLIRHDIDAKALHTIVRRCPMILKQSEESLEGTRQWLLDQGIAPSKMRRQLNPLVRVRQIPFIFLTAPHITGLNHENMNQKVEFLRGVGLDDDQIRTLLVRFPNCLLVTVENMASKVEGAKSLGLTDNDVVKVIRLVPQFLSFNMDSIQRKLQALDEMFGEGEAMRLWLSNVHLIGRNTEELRRTFEYLTKVVGMTPERISGNVQLIMRNVDRLVRPRYEYLTKIQSRDLEGVNWILQPETKFVSRHPDYADFLACEFKP